MQKKDELYFLSFPLFFPTHSFHISFVKSSVSYPVILLHISHDFCNLISVYIHLDQLLFLILCFQIIFFPKRSYIRLVVYFVIVLPCSLKTSQTENFPARIQDKLYKSLFFPISLKFNNCIFDFLGQKIHSKWSKLTKGDLT